MERITAEEYRSLIGIKTQSKYKNTRVQVDGKWFDSIGEANRYQELAILEKSGEISKLRHQVIIPLQGRNHMRIDYTYIENGIRIYEDWKPPKSYRKNNRNWREFVAKLREYKLLNPESKSVFRVSSTDGIEEI